MRQVEIRTGVAQVDGIQAIFFPKLTCVGYLLAGSPEPAPHSHHYQSQKMAGWLAIGAGREGVSRNLGSLHSD